MSQDATQRMARVDELNAQARAIRRFDYDRLRELAEQALELACEHTDEDEPYSYGMAEALAQLAHRSCVVGDWTSTLSQTAAALSLLDTDEPTLALGDIYDSLGWAHFCMGNYAEALDFLMRALDVAERIGDTSLQAYVLDSIANVHSATGHLELALETQDRALAMQRQLKDAMGVALILNNRAYTFMGLGDLDAAHQSAIEALEYSSKESRRYLLMGVLDTLAEIEIRRGDLATAEEYSRRGFTLAEHNQSETDRANSAMALGRIELLRNNLDEAERYVGIALDVAERFSRGVERYECYELLSQIAEKRADHAAALAHFKRFHSLREATHDGTTESRMANLRVAHQLENARKDAEILRLRSLALEKQVEEGRLAQAASEARASLDPLTGLFNRVHLEVLAEEAASATRLGVPVSLLLFDIDRFKRVNDTFGHLTGDRVLVEIARELQANARASDTPVRYGGDEFLVLLVGMDARAAHSAAERLRKAVSGVRVDDEAGLVAVTISVGVATAMIGDVLDSLISRADGALYRAKESGRNRVSVDAREARP